MSLGPLVDTSWLLERMGEPELRPVDTRWRLGGPGTGERAYHAGHIPGAAFLDVDRDLSAPPGRGGRHPLPASGEFQRVARSAGIGAETMVVAYDERGEGGAARLWWLLRHFGHGRVAALDGGLHAWREAGGPLRGSEEQFAPGAFRTSPRADDTADVAELRAGGVTLVDARGAERFRGEREPIDPVAGHIPGARNVPFTELSPEGRYLPPDELRERLPEVAPGDELVAYCGSGITASSVVLAAELAGIRARLYPGSWSEWCALGLPAARGEG